MFDKKNIKNIYELTPLQEGMLFHTLYDQESLAYFEQTHYHISGSLNISIFQATWQEIVKRHDILRTLFVHKSVAQPIQIVLKERPIPFHFEDIRHLSAEQQIIYCNQYLQQDKQHRFDLTKDPLMRITVFQLGDTSFDIIWTLHHILMDGWSLNIIQDEFFIIYNALKEKKSHHLSTPVPFANYVKWLKQQDKQAAKHYWQTYLQHYEKLATLPQQTTTNTTFITKTTDLHLSQAKTQYLHQLATENHITINTVIQAIWGIILAEYNNSTDVTFATTVSGRPSEIKGIEHMVGLFINAIPVRVNFSKIDNFTDLLIQLHQNATESKKYHYYSLADIQAATALKQNLFNHILVFENYRENQEKTHSADFIIDKSEHFDHTNYNLTVQIIPIPDALGFHIIYNQNIYATDLIENALQLIEKLINQLIDNQTLKLNSINLLTDKKTSFPSATWERDQRDQNSPVSTKNPSLLLVIAATFTAEPIESYLYWWCEQFGLNIELQLAPYNQIFQQLLDSTSLFSTNQGINCLFIRFEDWIRDITYESENNLIAHLEQNYAELITAFASQVGKMTFIAIFPISTHLNLPTAVHNYLQQLTQQWRDFALQNTYLLDFTTLPFLHNLTEIFDPQKDKIGHLPFTDEYYAAMGSYLTRQLLAWQKPHFKVIAVDCDNTLWQGICGEDGYLGIQITEPYLAIQRFLLQKVNEGFLLVLCSKNNENDVWEVFNKNPNMILQREHIVTYRINWQAKSQNLREMAEELNLCINSFVFIDDSAIECAEVMSTCPEVLTLQLPTQSKDIPAYLQNIWALDKFKVTDEDRQRSNMYLAEKQRQQQQQTTSSLTDFLQNLNIRIDMMGLQPIQLERVSQLTQRTNQFNLSTIRRTETEITQLLNNPNYVCWVIDVKDKFGSYGLVGIIITEKREKTLFLDTFLLSCRVLGRQVENVILAGLKNYCLQQGLTEIIAEYRPTAKNQPILTFLQTLAWQSIGDTTNGTLYQLTLENLPQLPDYIELNYDITPEPASYTIQKSTISAVTNINTSQASPHITYSPRNWTVVLTNENQLLHKIYYLPLQYHQSQQLLALSKSQLIVNKVKTQYKLPENDMQQRMLTIWQAVLEQEHIGILDNFLELGGHSLKATRIAARIYKEFNHEVSLRDIFDYPTIKQLCDILKQRTKIEYAPITPISNQPHYPLSYAQKRLWILHQMEENSIAYNNFAAYRLHGQLDIFCLESAFNLVIQRHEILRTYFITIENEPRQVIQASFDFHITVLDLSQQENQEKLIQYHAEQEANTSFNLTQLPLIRVKLLKLNENRHIFLLNLHHIISDGWSITILEQEVLSVYSSYLLQKENTLAPLTIQYKDYTIWQNQLLAGEFARKQQHYWQQKLAGELPILNLPTDYPRPSVQTFIGHTFYTQIDEINSLKNFAHQQDMTLFMVLIAVVKTLLFHYTEQTDLIVGSPVAGRIHPELENQIGFYVNTLALRDEINPQQDFIHFLHQVKATITEAYDNQLYPFDQLVSELLINRDMSRSPLFDVMVLLQQETTTNQIANFTIQPLEMDAYISRFDLTFNFTELATEKLQLAITYNTKLFKLSTIERLANHIDILIKNLLANPNQSIAQQSLVSAQESGILDSFNHHTLFPLPTQSIHALFEIQAAIIPDYIAISTDSPLTYGELNKKANQVAAFLQNIHQVQVGDIIGVMAERSAELIVNLLGILKAGGVYLPIDPNYPQQRIDYIIQNSGCKLILTRETVTALETDCFLPVTVQLCDLAYIIYTSGSTGQPKGVMIEHGSFVNMIMQQIQAFQVDKQDKILQFASPSFDASLSEIFMALLAGATLVPVQQEIIQDNNLFTEFLQETGITIATLPPIYLNTLDKQIVKNLKTLITAGEAANPEDAVFYAQYLNYFNAYGPTESAVCACYYRVNPNSRDFNKIPIGKPLANLAIYLVNSMMQLVPIGVIGEICIAGIGLARGYLHRSNLTAEKFIDNPFCLGEKLYKTGDLGKWTVEGNLEFLGRKDEQVKIRGYRIELAEITHCLSQHSEIIDSVVISQQNSLICYFVAKKSLIIDELKNYLRQFLPEYMIPTLWMQLAQLPLTPNGKVDKKALPVVNQLITLEFAKPRNDKEQQVALVWQLVLKREKISIYDNFFDLGGDSIRAIQIVAQLRQQYFLVETKDVFLYPTVAQLADVLIQHDRQVIAEQGLVIGFVPLTAIQVWFFKEYPIDQHYFNHAELFFNAARFDETALRTVFHTIQLHHDALRMTYRIDNNTRKIIQENQGNDYPFSFLVVKLDSIGLNALEEPIKTMQASLDLATGPLMKAVLFRQNDGDYLFVVIHHLVVDGISWRILLQDIIQGYQQYVKNKVIRLPNKTCSFKRWAEKIQEYSQSERILQEIPYWQHVESTPIKLLKPDFQVDDKILKNSENVSLTLSIEETDILLTKVPKYYRVTINAILLTALATALQQWHGEEKSLIMMESHGRQAILPDLDISRTVGWFTSTYPLILQLSESQDIVSQVNFIDNLLNQVPTEGGIHYGILKYVTPLEYKSTLHFQLQPQISFNYLGQYDDEAIEGFNVVGNASNYSVSERSKLLYDISINAIVTQKRFTIVLVYPQQSYLETTMSSILLTFKDKLKEIIDQAHLS